MNNKQAVIITIILAASVSSIIGYNHYDSVRNFELENTPEQLESIFSRCDCQERVKNNPGTNQLCLGSLVDWQNSTHYIDNNLCEFITLEEQLNKQK